MLNWSLIIIWIDLNKENIQTDGQTYPNRSLIIIWIDLIEEDVEDCGTDAIQERDHTNEHKQLQNANASLEKNLKWVSWKKVTIGEIEEM